MLVGDEFLTGLQGNVRGRGRHPRVKWGRRCWVRGSQREREEEAGLWEREHPCPWRGHQRLGGGPGTSPEPACHRLPKGWTLDRLDRG